VVEHAALAGIVLSRDVDARLFVQPPVRQSEVVRHPAGLLDHHAMGNERGVNVASRAGGILGQAHGGTADHEDIGDDTPSLQALAQGGKSTFHLGPAEKNIVGFGHAASKSRTDR
jgi:hypothetical protein